MIQAPSRPPRAHKFTAYDFEWRELEEGQLVITLAGAYDERGYRAYRTLADFLRGELTEENCDRRFYAHFGGAADMVFLFRELAKDESYNAEAVFSSSSAILVRVQKGRKKRGCKNPPSWVFLDSFWTMRTRLAKIGEWLGEGMAKGKVNYQTASFAELAEYNEQDCRILFTALHRMQETLLEKGSELAVTAASTAMQLFLRRYLKRPIKNSEFLDDFAREGYVASRVEPFRYECESANYFDINSSFPYSMTFPLPGNLRSIRKVLPDKGLWISRVKVRVPDQYAPPLPWRGTDGRIYFPTGEFETTITSEDYLCGGFDVLSVESTHTYEERDDLSEFATDLYMLRKGGGFQSEVWKIVLNSLYGKFAEKADKEKLYLRPEFIRPEWTGIAPHLFLAEEIREVPHSHVALSAMITSRSRRFLLEHLRDAHSKGRVYYCDTDSIVCDAWLKTGKRLGELKHEYTVTKGRFVAPKVYSVDTPSERELIKAKGFSRVVSEAGDRTALDYATFAKLCEGRSITIERMRRIRELSRSQGLDYQPDTVRSEKSLAGARPKRKPLAWEGLSGGDSRAWEVSELEAE